VSAIVAHQGEEVAAPLDQTAGQRVATAPRAMVVGSICCGTGGGAILDTAYYPDAAGRSSRMPSHALWNWNLPSLRDAKQCVLRCQVADVADTGRTSTSRTSQVRAGRACRFLEVLALRPAVSNGSGVANRDAVRSILTARLAGRIAYRLDLRFAEVSRSIAGVNVQYRRIQR
jgi:hypothetical protein